MPKVLWPAFLSKRPSVAAKSPLTASRSQLAIFTAFWLLGLINNVLYVILLTAALDLVGSALPKGLVLIFDVAPSFLVKLVAPYFIHLVPYNVRVTSFVALSVAGMLLVALTPPTLDAGSIAIKLLGVAVASLSSGGGELTFLGLTHYYGHLSLSAWSSGTGAAGLVGAGAYVLVTGTLRMHPQSALLVSAALPGLMLVSFFLILPNRTTAASSTSTAHYQVVETNDLDVDRDGPVEDMPVDDRTQPLLPPSQAFSNSDSLEQSFYSKFRANLRRAKGLFFPYMVPLLLVYIGEYVINQGVAPTLLFPLDQTPFHEFREFYPTYNAIYQVGVFLSRSSSMFIRIHALYPPSLLQLLNLVILTLHALFNFIPSVWIVFAIVFWEGLLGGSVYVNTFAEITDNVPMEEREFSLSATTVSDSAIKLLMVEITAVGHERFNFWMGKVGGTISFARVQDASFRTSW